MGGGRLNLQHTLLIQAQPARVLDAFVQPADLSAWWQVVRSVTVPRPLGAYAVEWLPTAYRDDVLGRLGGAFHGTVMGFDPGRELFVSDAYWQPPEGRPVGPMAFEVRCRATNMIFTTEVTVRQSATDEGVRWQRYFAIMDAGWQRALSELKRYLEAEARATG